MDNFKKCNSIPFDKYKVVSQYFLGLLKPCPKLQHAGTYGTSRSLFLVYCQMLTRPPQSNIVSVHVLVYTWDSWVPLSPSSFIYTLSPPPQYQGNLKLNMLNMVSWFKLNLPSALHSCLYLHYLLLLFCVYKYLKVLKQISGLFQRHVVSSIWH